MFKMRALGTKAVQQTSLNRYACAQNNSNLLGEEDVEGEEDERNGAERRRRRKELFVLQAPVWACRL